MTDHYAALALFSGGLDSILAMKTVVDQGLGVLGLHFCSPFFGHPHKIPFWKEEYGLDIQSVDIHEEFTAMLRTGPRFGYGKVLNPCVDCKVLMLTTARSLLSRYGARFVISGEVLAQRPMSQRRDALNLISKQAQVQDVLLRPLSAHHFKPTPMEEKGLVDRSRLHGISGRGRKDQLRLAEALGVVEIPTPAGGCLLAEKESAKRFWPVLTRVSTPEAHDFELANIGRQYWNKCLWLIVGRNRRDNELLGKMQGQNDLLFKAVKVQGPLGLGRQQPGMLWKDDDIHLAAAFVAGFSEKYCLADAVVRVRVTASEEEFIVSCAPEDRLLARKQWGDPTWDQVRKEKKTLLSGS